MSTGKARPMNSCMAFALARAMCTTQRLCSMNVMGQFGNQQGKGNLAQVFRLQRAALQSLYPDLRHLFPQFGTLDPVDLWPQLVDDLAHGRSQRNA